MQLEYTKRTLAAVWVLGLSAVGLAINVSSVAGWTVLASLALLPPLVMMRLWNHPPQSVSESIQEALR